MLSLPPKGNEAKVLGSYFSPLKVQAQSTPAMTVQVAEGSFWLADGSHQEFIGGTTPTLSAASANAKWSLITVTKDGLLNVVDGTEGTSPTLPLPATYKDELPLAAVFLGDTVTSITNEMIFDVRPLWSIPPDSVSQAQLDNLATITYVNNQVASKADNDGTAEPTFTLNAGGGTINHAAFAIDRNLLPDVAIRFNETAMAGSPPAATPQWEFTNDGIVWTPLGVAINASYTKAELDGGQLDTLYYTQTDADLAFTPLAHASDLLLHMSSAEHTFLGGLNLPTVSGADVNQLIGITSNVQAQLDGKLSSVGGITKATISDFVESDYVHTSGDEVVAGVKSFTDDIEISGNLTVSGTSTTINTQNLTVGDKNIILNFGYVGATSGSTGAGITVDRNAAGSPVPDAPASIVWDDATTRWKAGLVASEVNIALEGVTRAQPFYELVSAPLGSPVTAIYNLGFAVPAPVGATAALQVFVNGIKQIEGAGKAFQANYTGNVIVTFEAGSEPTPGADVEFYGFGYIG